MAAYPQKGTRGTGRRKEAVARVRLVPGSGRIVINGQTVEQYLGHRKALEVPVLQPLVAAGVRDRYDVVANVHGGGKVGQAGAIKLGIARALSILNPDYKQTMREEQFLTRDPRAKERKKYGRKKARKRFQYSKR